MQLGFVNVGTERLIILRGDFSGLFAKSCKENDVQDNKNEADGAEKWKWEEGHLYACNFF